MRLTAHEKHRRSIAKSVSYRVLMVTIDALVAFYFTHNVALSAGIVVFVDGYSTLVYYFHERIWAHVHWGRNGHMVHRRLDGHQQ